MNANEEFVLRLNDFTLDAEQEALRDTFRAFVDKQCPSDRVRASEKTGWDPDLWNELHELGPVAMGVPVAAGGDGAGLVELTLLCEQLGRSAAPVPFVDTVIAARALASIRDDVARGLLDRLLAGEVASLALSPPDASGRHLTGWGAAAALVLACTPGGLVVADPPRPGQLVANLARSPMAWRSLAEGRLLADVVATERIQAEWRLLTAAVLVGLGDAALTLAVTYAKDRSAFGVPIGSFQAIAHPLVDVAIGIESARRLVHKAAWYYDHEPESLGGRLSMAFIHAAESAERAGYVAIHTQGGFGFTVESDVQLFYRKAKTWPLLAGDRRQEYQRLADALYGAVAGRGGVA